MKNNILSLYIFIIACTAFPAYASDISIDMMTGQPSGTITSEYIEQNLSGIITNIQWVQYYSMDSLQTYGSITSTDGVINPVLSRIRADFMTVKNAAPVRMPEIRTLMSDTYGGTLEVSMNGESGISVSLNLDTDDIADQLPGLSGTEADSLIPGISFSQNQAENDRDDITTDGISPHAIGINWQKTCFVNPAKIHGVTLLDDFFVSYQPLAWLKLKFGFTHVYMEMWDDTVVNTSDIYPNYICTLTDYNPLIKTGYGNGKINQAVPYLGAEYTCMISPSFVLDAGLGATIFMPDNLRFEQTFTLYSARKNESETVDMANRTMVLTQTFDTAAMFRMEIKPRYFISSRASIGLYIAVTYTTPLRVTKAAFEDGIALGPHAKTDPDDIHLGFSATQMGVRKGGDVEDDLKLTGYAMNLSAGFYF